jgi:HEAT repeat protein
LKAIPDLLERLGDKNLKVRQVTILSLGELGGNSVPVREAVMAFANDSDPIIRRNVIVALANLGHVSEKTGAILFEALGSDTKVTAKAAGKALVKLGQKEPAKILPGLIKLLEENKEPSVKNVLRILRRLKYKAVSVLPQIARAYDTVDPKNRWRIIETIVAIDKKGDVAVPVVAKALKDPDSFTRREALLGLMRYRSRLNLYADNILEALKDEEMDNRMVAIGLLRSLGVKADKAVPELIRLTKDPAVRMRRAAVRALSTFSPPTEAVLKALGESLKDPNDKVRIAAVHALRLLGQTDAEKVAPILEKARSADQPERVKQLIVYALRSLPKTRQKRHPLQKIRPEKQKRQKTKGRSPKISKGGGP